LAEFQFAHKYARKRAKTQSIRQLFVNGIGGRHVFLDLNLAILQGFALSLPPRD
jgi:hypothetical protein